MLRAADHDIATGVWPDMTEHGVATDEWPETFPRVMSADILMIAGPIWLDDNSSVTKRVIERLYALAQACSTKLGGTPITGASAAASSPATGRYQALRHERHLQPATARVWYTIPPQADAGWIGEAGPGPSYLDTGSGGPDTDFTNRNTTFMTWNSCTSHGCQRTLEASQPKAINGLPGTPEPGSIMRIRVSLTHALATGSDRSPAASLAATRHRNPRLTTRPRLVRCWR